MLGYTIIGTNDLAKAKTFYDPLLAMLGARQLMQLDRGVLYGDQHPQFGIMTPFNGDRAEPGNGTMIALMPPSRAVIDAMYAKAIAMGGTDEGAPGVRGPNPDGFYGAYFRDLDGNKLCLFRMGPA